jgi:hypothetical protein
MCEGLVASSLPSWLRIGGEVKEPRFKELAARYAAFACSMLQQQQAPEDVWIVFHRETDGFVIEISIQPEHRFLVERELLEWLADEFWRMSCMEGRANAIGSVAKPADQASTQPPTADMPEQNGPTQCGFVRTFRWDARRTSDGGRSLGRDSDTAAKIKRVLDRLTESGPDRRLIEPPASWLESLQCLMDGFPAFVDVLQRAVRPHLTLRAMGIDHRLSPILLVGAPGVGKTYFASAVARALGVDNPAIVSMASESNGATLAGSSVFWSNCAPGALFEILAWGRGGSEPIANPVVVLDEIDKVSSGRYSPTGALYSLLERHTAEAFQDQALPDVQIDASHVRFVATANETATIPEPLLSRFAVFHIEPPSKAQQVMLAKSIFQVTAKELGIAGRIEVDERVFEMASGLSVRELRMQTQAAFALALSAGRKIVGAEDWNDLRSSFEPRRRIGF